MATRLKLIGYWNNRFRKGLFWWPLWATGENKEMPCPRNLVDPLWRGEDRQKIVDYLRAGHHAYSWLGYSSCRFRCGIPDESLGDSELTDGIWAWPEGLTHYVEHHFIRLPEAFVEHVVKNDYIVPSSVTVPPLRTGEKIFGDAFWIAWSRGRQQDGAANCCQPINTE